MFHSKPTLEPVEAHQALERFARRSGEAALRLALHAAVPSSFRADLLHLLRVNFVPAAMNDRAVEADVLFASFCECLGSGYFRFDDEVRRQLLETLRLEYVGQRQTQIRRVANFLLWYIEGCERNTAVHLDPRMRDFLEVQRWVAAAFLDPQNIAEYFAKTLQELEQVAAPVARLQLGRLADALTLSLPHQHELLAYATGLNALESQNSAAANAIFRTLGDRPLVVGSVVLQPPGGSASASAVPPPAVHTASETSKSEDFEHPWRNIAWDAIEKWTWAATPNRHVDPLSWALGFLTASGLLSQQALIAASTVEQRIALCTAAVQAFQRFAGIAVDGILRNETYDAMSKYRVCRLLSNSASPAPRRSPNQPRPSQIRYFVSSTVPENIGDVPTAQLLQEAWSRWLTATRVVDVRQTPSEQEANLVVEMREEPAPDYVFGGAHLGGGSALSGPLRCYLSTRESWTAESFTTAACHQFGHILGIDHYDQPGLQLMSAILPADMAIRGPQPEDIRRLQELWGAPQPPVDAQEKSLVAVVCPRGRNAFVEEAIDLLARRVNCSIFRGVEEYTRQRSFQATSYDGLVFLMAQPTGASHQLSELRGFLLRNRDPGPVAVLWGPGSEEELVNKKQFLRRVFTIDCTTKIDLGALGPFLFEVEVYAKRHGTQDAPRSPREDVELDVVLSYALQDQTWAYGLRESLEKHGFTVHQAEWAPNTRSPASDAPSAEIASGQVIWVVTVGEQGLPWDAEGVAPAIERFTSSGSPVFFVLLPGSTTASASTASAPSGATFDLSRGITGESVGQLAKAIRAARHETADATRTLDGDAAVQKYEELLAVHERLARANPSHIGHQRDLSITYERIGDLEFRLGNVQAALQAYQESLSIAQVIADRRREGSINAKLGKAYSALEYYVEAVGYHEKALAMYRELDDRRSEGNALGDLGSAHAELRQFEQARECWQGAVRIGEEINDRDLVEHMKEQLERYMP